LGKIHLQLIAKLFACYDYSIAINCIIILLKYTVYFSLNVLTIYE